MNQAEIQAEYAAKPAPGDVEIPTRIFVKGFPRDTTEDDLKTFFERFGIVRDSKIVKEKTTGASKGYAFITFDSQEIAEKMKEQLTVQYNSKELVIGPARIRKKRPFYRNRPDQLWPAVAMNNMQQPVYYSVSPDGLWYFQSPVAPMVPVMPQMAVQPYGTSPQPSWQANAITPTGNFNPSPFYASSGVGVGPNGGNTTILANGATYELVSAPSNVTDVLKTACKVSSSPETTDFNQTNAGTTSPVQCVPVYDGINLLPEDCLVGVANEGHNVVVIDTTDRKVKRVLMKRDQLLPGNANLSPLPTSAEP